MNTASKQTRRDFVSLSALITGSVFLNVAMPPTLFGANDPLSMQKANNVTVPETLGELVAPPQAALLVYDMQAGIVPYVQESERVKQTVVRLIAGAHQKKIPVFYSRHFQLPLKTIGAAQLRSAMRFQRVSTVSAVVPSLQKGSPETQLVPELPIGPDDVVFDKLGMSFFIGTPLEFCLRDLGVASVIVTGCVAEIGIQPTVLHAEDLGFFTVTVSDACGSMSLSSHQQVMKDLAGIGSVTESNAVLAAWSA
jgi:biuret amidohydrolase